MGSVCSFVFLLASISRNIYPIMSWQEYINTQMVGKNLKEAAIAGTDGNIWAKSSSFDIQPAAGQKYFYLSGDERVMRGKLGKGGVHVMRTKQALLVGVYDDPMQPAQAATITETLGEYLKGVGY